MMNIIISLLYNSETLCTLCFFHITSVILHPRQTRSRQRLQSFTLQFYNVGFIHNKLIRHEHLHNIYTCTGKQYIWSKEHVHLTYISSLSLNHMPELKSLSVDVLFCSDSEIHLNHCSLFYIGLQF